MLIGWTADMLILRFSKLPLESGFSFACYALDKTCELNLSYLIFLYNMYMSTEFYSCPFGG